MKNTKRNLIVSATLIFLLCSILFSSVYAANDNESRTSTNEVPVTSQEPALTSIEEPNLIATVNSTTTDDSSQLYRQRDNSTAEATDTAGSESNDTLILSQAVPDYTVYVVVAVGLVSVIAMSLIFIFVKNRK